MMNGYRHTAGDHGAKMFDLSSVDPNTVPAIYTVHDTASASPIRICASAGQANLRYIHSDVPCCICTSAIRYHVVINRIKENWSYRETL